MSCSEEVILEIEGTPVKCKRDVLISNSDYFKAMLEGNFIEKDQKTISIKDVDLKAVNIILTLLGDPRNDTEDEDVLMILHAACMLQFCEIRNMCLDKLNQILSVQNCLKVWIMAEQLELKPLVLKAKRLALTEFMSIIKENDSINDLNLQQLIRYIGSVHLVTDSELTVFQTLMKWWYDHSKDHTSDDFIKLLSCVNYKQLLPDHFREILTYPDLAITEVEDILKCLYNLLNNIPNISCSKKCLKVASVLSQSNDRKIIIDSVPCLLVRNSSNDVPNKKRLVENNEIGVDKSKLRVVYYDRKLDIFRRFVNNLKQFEVFKVKGYQEYIFLVGGICVPSNAEWNYSLLVYDSIKEIWETKSSMPFRRRHFEICVVGSKVFITGSRGHPGIIESNIFWYDYKTDEWSKEYECPKHLLEKSSKCCNYLDKFLILNLNMKCVCMFEENSGFTIFPLVFPPTLGHDIKNIATECGEFSLFSYKDRLYLKDRSKLHVIYYDRKLGVFRRFVNISEEVEKQFRRFILKGYKEYIFLFGGEHLVHVPGDVERKYSLLIYDSIKEIWITKTRMPFPFPRTHFEACIVGSKVFISGSIGKNRFIPANIFYYDYKTNEWSEQYTCPQRILERSYKCCNYLDKFLVFSLYKKCACVFEDSGFTIWPVVFPPTLHHDTKKIWVECGNFSLFAYKDRLYLKGKKILEMKKVPDGLEVISIKSLSTVKYDYLKTTICDNMVYTLYREQMMNGYRYSFEKCNLDTHEMDIIFDGLKTLQVEENIFNLDLPDHSLNIFSVSHHKLFDENELVNKNF